MGAMEPTSLLGSPDSYALYLALEGLFLFHPTPPTAKFDTASAGRLSRAAVKRARPRVAVKPTRVGSEPRGGEARAG